MMVNRRASRSSKAAREPGTFWHNIGHHVELPDDTWWRTLKERGEICASFDNEPDDKGERLLRGYITGDRVIAYASGHGAIGWGLIELPTYRLLGVGDPGDIFPEHFQRHRLDIAWKAVAAMVTDAVSQNEIMARFNIHHPISTRARVADGQSDDLIRLLSERFGT